jgi:hypothetical protein
MPTNESERTDSINQNGFIDVETFHLPDGHSVYEYNYVLKSTPVVVDLNANNVEHEDGSIQKRLVIQPNCFYTSAKNLKKAKKKFIEMLMKRHNVNARLVK